MTLSALVQSGPGDAHSTRADGGVMIAFWDRGQRTVVLTAFRGPDTLALPTLPYQDSRGAGIPYPADAALDAILAGEGFGTWERMDV